MKNINSIHIIVLLLFLGNLSFPQGQKLNIYGFFDFEVEANNQDSASKIWTFDQHHLNVLANYKLDDRFRVATEIEYEHGPMHSAKEITGNIYLAKAFLEYKYSDALFTRVGIFLSPFGIYNERHDATPTFLSTILPESVYGKKEFEFRGKNRLFAKHSTGIQVLGNLFMNDWGVKYHVYLSNGRGPKQSEADNNTNKGFGWRFVISPPIEELRIGTSFYSDKNGDAGNASQTTFGFDVEFDLSAFHVEAEIIIPELENLDTSSVPTGSFTTVNGYYILGAYTLFDRLTPFVRYEFFDPDIDIKNNGENMIMVGLNYAVTPSVYLKGEVHFHSHQIKDNLSEKHETFISSIAVAF